jgi:hypothetical protein
MTDREKLVGIMGEIPIVFCDCCGEDYLQNKMLLLADHLIANGVTVQRWISVKDRLPENETNVLCWRGISWCGPEIFTYGDLKGEECFYYIDDCGYPMKCLRPSITHWMPLPEPPKEE